jgi:NAD(P)-dependent dehydrogenase (short-subunit alcohol dehydrogenase family)
MAERSVLVTGGSRGIGRAIIHRCLQDGYDVINLDKIAPLALLAGETLYQADLTDASATQHILQQITRDRNVVRVVNNAGFIRPAALEDATLDDFDAVCALNLRAPMLVAQALRPLMQAARFGRIINISSRAALGKEDRTIYAATKAGLLGMTRTWALELAPFGVTVNAIGPGPIATELFTSGNPPDAPKTKKIIEAIPLKRMGEPEDVAHAVASLLDDRAGFITGQVLYVCGGMTVGLGHAS